VEPVVDGVTERTTLAPEILPENTPRTVFEVTIPYSVAKAWPDTELFPV
jgi:hypothetical protein